VQIQEFALEIDALPGGLNDQENSDQTLSFPDNRLLIDLCGEFDRNLTIGFARRSRPSVARDNGHAGALRKARSGQAG